MKKLYLFLLIFLAGEQLVYSQVEKWPDKYICEIGQGVEIGELPEDSKFCYSWKASPIDPNIVFSKAAKITVNPQVTTIYTLSVIGQDFSYLKIYEVKVQVLEGFNIIILNQPGAGFCDGEEVPLKIEPIPTDFPIAMLSCLKKITLSSTTLKKSFGNPIGTTTLTFEPINDKLESKIKNAIWYSTEMTDCNVFCFYEIDGFIMLNGKKIFAKNKGQFGVNAQADETPNIDICLWGNAHIISNASGAPLVFSGDPVINTKRLSNGTFEAEVTQGTFKRDIHATTSYTNHTMSQFWNIIVSEEEYHKKQFEGTVKSSAMGGLFDVGAVMKATLKQGPFIGKTEIEAINKVKPAFLKAGLDEFKRSTAILKTDEWRCKFECEAKKAIKAIYGKLYLLEFNCTYKKELGCNCQ